MSYELVIFDCDGVLVDSETIYCQVLRNALAPLGLIVSAEEVFGRFVGKASDARRALIQDLIGRPLHAEFESQLRDDLHAVLRTELKPIPGVVELLQGLSLPCCVASNGSLASTHTSLEVAGLLPYFGSRVFSAEQVAAPKPAPDLFLHAAEVMGCDPRSAVVVEDSVVGVQAAVAADMHVLGYTATVGAGPLEAAGAQVFHQMTALLEILCCGQAESRTANHGA